MLIFFRQYQTGTKIVVANQSCDVYMIPVVAPILAVKLIAARQHQYRKYRKAFEFRGCILIIPDQEK